MLYAAACAFIGLVLLLDSGTASISQQHLLAPAVFAFLWWVMQRNTPAERREVWLCIAVSTSIELAATQLWGLYSYRHGNVPLYVPPGHGLIYAISAIVSRSGWMEAHGKALSRAVVAVAAVWAVAGLTVLPRWTGQVDVHGALYLPFFAWCSLVPRYARHHARPFAATFGMVAVIELVGVAVGNWHWAAQMPGLGFPAADPPSVVAGGYCFFGYIAYVLSQRPLFSRRVVTEAVSR